jgi:hypothetical protein
MENQIIKKPRHIQIIRFITLGFIVYLFFSFLKSIFTITIITDETGSSLISYLLTILLSLLLPAILLFIFQKKLNQKKNNIFFWLHLSFISLILGGFIIDFFINFSFYFLTWILFTFFIKKYYDKDIKEKDARVTTELPRKNRLIFYLSLIFGTAIVIGLIILAVSLSDDFGYCPGCAVLFLIILVYILVIDIFIIAGFETHRFRKKSFWISLIVTILIPPILFGGTILSDEIRSNKSHKIKLKRIENRAIAIKYISEGNFNECVNYVSANKVDNSIYNTEDAKQFCEHMLALHEFYLIGDTKNISLCTQDLCFYKYALEWNDISACNKINEKILKDECKELYLK